MFSSNNSQVSSAANYIEDCFSTYLYTGTGALQTITNGIDLSTKGGMSWSKRRDAIGNHFIQDTASGSSYYLQSDSTAGRGGTTGVTFLTNGYSMSSGADMNISGRTNVNWTFRKQPKFFDVVTYTGTGSATTIAHNLGSVPGCIIVKRTDTTGNWQVYHNGLTSAAYSIQLNLTNAQASATTVWNSTAPTSTVFSVGTNSTVNASGGTYVAYLFAHNAGGFGLTGTDNVITCGTFTLDSINKISVTLGYEPQWLLFKSASGVENWWLFDNMRGFNYSQTNYLSPNTSAAETSFSDNPSPTATGFVINSASIGSGDYIYIAIRRGPMKVPTSGTSVFSPNAYAGTSSAQTQTTNFPVDLFINKTRNAASDNFAMDRLRGSTQEVETNTTAAESSLLNIGFDSNTGVKFLGSQLNGSGSNFILWSFRRAPGFFDEVCYTGTSATQNISHNLGVVPELMIIKDRTAAQGWPVYNSTQGNTKILLLNSSGNGFTSSTYWNSTTPTSSVFTVGTNALTNSSGSNFVAYLFATCAGVSKVGSYTGNGSTQTIDCGFTGGARFVLIKRTDSSGAWIVYDTARGINSGANDPFLTLTFTNAEANTEDAIDPASTGFIIKQEAGRNLNVSGGTYIYLAIA